VCTREMQNLGRAQVEGAGLDSGVMCKQILARSQDQVWSENQCK